MYISQQAVSKQLKALENELGFKLLDRTSQGVVLTKFGEFPFPKWKYMVEENEAYLEQARLLHMAENGPVRVGIIDNLMRGAVGNCNSKKPSFI